jgi:hypothetical protein
MPVAVLGSGRAAQTASCQGAGCTEEDRPEERGCADTCVAPVEAVRAADAHDPQRSTRILRKHPPLGVLVVFGANGRLEHLVVTPDEDLIGGRQDLVVALHEDLIGGRENLVVAEARRGRTRSGPAIAWLAACASPSRLSASGGSSRDGLRRYGLDRDGRALRRRVGSCQASSRPPSRGNHKRASPSPASSAPGTQHYE